MCALHTYSIMTKYAVSTSRMKKYHHGNLRQTLLDLARERLEREGPDGLSLRALAQEAGVSTMAPYRHFANHDVLLASLTSMGFLELHDCMARFDSQDPRLALTAFAAAYVNYARRHRQMFHLMYGSGIPTPQSGQAEDASTVLGLVNKRLAQLVPAEKLAEARLAGWSMIHGFATLIAQRRVRTPPKNIAATARRLMEIVFDGLLENIERSISLAEQSD